MSNSKRYKLPKFPEHVKPTFEKLCGPLEAGESDKLREQVDRYIAHLVKAAKEKPVVDINLVSEIAARVRVLLDHYEEFPDKERRLITGAVRYFLCHDDPLSDLAFRSGLIDDAKVINYVLQQICIEDMFIEIVENP